MAIGAVWEEKRKDSQRDVLQINRKSKRDAQSRPVEVSWFVVNISVD